MNNPLVNKMTAKRIKDYSYVVIFFLIFSFFIFFAIRPNIETAFTLKKQLTELERLDKNYEMAILHIIDIQNILEKNRSQYGLLAEALPAAPQVNKVVDDLHTAASQSGLVMERVAIDQVNLKAVEQKDLRHYLINLETSSDFLTVKKFFDNISVQRRIKTIDSLIIKKVEQSTESAALTIQFQINGYYL